jgi:hypothetical protein
MEELADTSKAPPQDYPDEIPALYSSSLRTESPSALMV